MTNENFNNVSNLLEYHYIIARYRLDLANVELRRSLIVFCSRIAIYVVLAYQRHQHIFL